jgi:hypothetical protein
MLQVLRRNTQRRVTPKGYPYFPSENEMLMGRNTRTSNLSFNSKASRATKMELDDLWQVSVSVVN